MANVAQEELRVCGADVVGELAGEGFTTGTSAGNVITAERMLSEDCGIRYWEDSVFFLNFGKGNPYLAYVRKPSPRISHEPSRSRANWSLTRRESEVLDLLRTGASDKEIAKPLGVSRSTASKHVENILKKMKVPNRTAAVSLSWGG